MPLTARPTTLVPPCRGHCIAVQIGPSVRGGGGGNWHWARHGLTRSVPLRAAQPPPRFCVLPSVSLPLYRAGGRQHSIQHIWLGLLHGQASLRQPMLPAGRAQARRARRRRTGACSRCRSCSARWRSARRPPRRRPRRCCRSAARASIWSPLCPGAAGSGFSERACRLCSAGMGWHQPCAPPVPCVQCRSCLHVVVRGGARQCTPSYAPSGVLLCERRVVRLMA